MKRHGIIISDIHFGAVASNELKQELDKVFIDYIGHMEQIDFIIFNGDLFDHKIYLNDRTSDYVLSFMDSVVEIARQHNCPIRCVYGTESHEVSQYNIFSIYENDNGLDFKVIKTAQEEELLQGMKVLYVPEEYIYSKKEHYADFFAKEGYYDYVFGHGVIQEVMTEAVRSNHKKSDKSERKKVPYFTTSELIHMCKGQIYFGHYHINTNISDKLFYVGSFSRWMFGESEDKGFYHTTCDTEKGVYEQEFIVNELCKRYDTFVYGYESPVLESSETLLAELGRVDKKIEAKDLDYVRFIFNIPENHPNPEFIIDILNERYRFNDGVKVKVTNGYVDKKKKINKEKLNSAMDEFPMIFDKSASLENKVVYFIKKRYNRDISEETVKNYLYGTNE